MCQAGEFPLDEKLTSPIASEPQVLSIFFFQLRLLGVARSHPLIAPSLIIPVMHSQDRGVFLHRTRRIVIVSQFRERLLHEFELD